MRSDRIGIGSSSSMGHVMTSTVGGVVVSPSERLGCKMEYTAYCISVEGGGGGFMKQKQKKRGGKIEKNFMK